MDNLFLIIRPCPPKPYDWHRISNEIVEFLRGGRGGARFVLLTFEQSYWYTFSYFNVIMHAWIRFKLWNIVTLFVRLFISLREFIRKGGGSFFIAINFLIYSTYLIFVPSPVTLKTSLFRWNFFQWFVIKVFNTREGRKLKTNKQKISLLC